MGFIRAFAEHRIASNLLMLAMLVSGLAVAGKMETRFFPAFDTQTIRVSVSWPGAAAEDVVDAMLVPMENELRGLADLEEMFSTARDGGGNIELEFPEDADLQQATNDVRRLLGQVSNRLPADAETPKVSPVERKDEILRIALTAPGAGVGNRAELQTLARRLQKSLTALNVASVEVDGLPKQEIRIVARGRNLDELGLTIADIGRQLARQNVDISAGEVGGGSSRLLRAAEKRDQPAAFANMEIVGGGGEVLRLGDIADVRLVAEKNAAEIFFDGEAAVEFRLFNKSGGDMLAAAEALYAWAAAARQTLPAGAKLVFHRERWRAVESRLNLLLENGAQGLVLVLLFLLLFLRARVAFWVAAGIPATFMVALWALYLSGNSINMISLFAFIMVTGIIVDDAIVVSENSMYKLQQGAPPLAAAVRGAQEMFPAVFSSTFTTFASFLPLLFVGGGIGAIMATIPIVVVCALLASLFECFLVLPGHARGAFAAIAKEKENIWRKKIDAAFLHFQEGVFRRSIGFALRRRWLTVAAAAGVFLLSVLLLISGFLKYRFFPGAELNRVNAQVVFSAGAARADLQMFMNDVAAAAHLAAAQFPEEENLLRHLSIYINNDNNAQIRAELSQPDERNISTADFARKWRQLSPTHPDLERFALRDRRGGPHRGDDLEIRLSGGDNDRLKAASLELQTALLDVPGVSKPSDDMPYGRRQTVFELNARGRALNLTVEDIARQLRNAFDGYRVQTLYDGEDETDVRVFADAEGADLSVFRVRLPGGGAAALGDVADLVGRRGFDSVRRINAYPMVNVAGSIDFSQTTEGRVVRQIQNDILPAIAGKYGISYSFEGARADERQTNADMKAGLLAALAGIFIILAAVFSSWTLPFVVLLTVPFGVTGAMLGHWLLGYDMSVLSVFGVFTLNGIIVNDSIILVRDYLARRKDGNENEDAILTDAVCRRLRAILLTSLTTIGGLIPLLFETSIQAQFLIPMAVSICFGLAFATFLILYLTPALISIHNSCIRGAKELPGFLHPFQIVAR